MTVAPIVHSGGKWLPPRKVVLTDLHDTESEYLVRWVVFRIPWFGLQVHHIKRPDNDRHLHNHPRSFLVLILKGGYREQTVDGWRQWRVGSFHRMTLDMFHSIRQMPRRTAWTLVAVGPQRQPWGFLTEDGFVEADQYPAYLATTDEK